MTLALRDGTARVRVGLARAALFLDLDGTLAAIAPRPDAVGPEAGRTALLSRAGAALDGRLAVISGRVIADIDRILEACVTCVAGVHGLQRRDANGRVETLQDQVSVARAREVFEAAGPPGLLIEDKGAAVAVHYRAVPDLEDVVRGLAEDAAAATGLVVQPGRMVVELRAPGADKGSAVRAFMAEPPFAGAIPIFVGDDLTDEDGFHAATRLGGFGVLVGEPRATSAALRLQDPAAVLRWIERSLDLGVFADGEP